MKSKLDKKGILSFIIITFSITYAIEIAMMLAGVRFDNVPPMFAQIIIMAVMWVPAVAAIITIKYVTKEGFGIANIRIGDIRPYLISMLVIPLCFLIIYCITVIFRLGSPDWQLTGFIEMIKSQGADISEMPSPALIIPPLFFASIIVTPFVNGIFGFGEELGWRGYLLPKLMPLGKLKAYILVGIVWGLWHAPLIFMNFKYTDNHWISLVVFILLLTAMGIYINELTLHYKSSILAGFIHGAINAQFYGIWPLLFPDINPLIGGGVGIIAVLIWALLGINTIRFIKRNEDKLTPML